MTNTYVNRRGMKYDLPNFGPPVRWLSSVFIKTENNEFADVFYFECDSKNLGCRAIHVYNDGRVLLAYPGGLDGDHLPEGELPAVGATDSEGLETREITSTEFNALWAALSRLEAGN